MKAARLADGLALALAFVAAVAVAQVSQRVFERMPHLEDEFAYLWQAEVFAQGDLTLPSPAEPASFLVPFVVDYQGQRFGKYPPGWPAALSLGARVGAPWAVNTLLAAAAVWLVYRLGEKLASAGVGLLAALLTATSPMFLMLSGSLMSHTFGLVLGLAFALAWLDLFVSPRPSSPAWLLALVAGLSLGLLVLTRPLSAAGLALPFGLYGLVILIERERRIKRRLVVLAALALIVAAILPLWQAAVTGNPLINPYTLWWDYDRLGFGPGHGHVPGGHSLYWAYYNTRFSLRAGLHDLFGWPYLSWLFIPFGLWALRRRRGAFLVAATFPSLVFVYGAYWIGAWLFGPRYYYESLSALAVLSAAGAFWLAGWFPAHAARGRWRGALVVAVLAALIGANVLYYLPARIGGMHGLYHIDREQRKAFEAVAPHHALVIVHAKRWFQYGTLLTLVPPFRDSDFKIVMSQGARANARVEAAYPEWRIVHYYPDEPGVIYDKPRPPEEAPDQGGQG